MKISEVFTFSEVISWCKKKILNGGLLHVKFYTGLRIDLIVQEAIMGLKSVKNRIVSNKTCLVGNKQSTSTNISDRMLKGPTKRGQNSYPKTQAAVFVPYGEGPIGSVEGSLFYVLENDNDNSLYKEKATKTRQTWG